MHFHRYRRAAATLVSSSSICLALSLLRSLYARSFSDRRRLRPLTPFRRTHFVASALTKMDESISERHSFRRNGSECALRFMVERMRGPWLSFDWVRLCGLGVNSCLISHTLFFSAWGTCHYPSVTSLKSSHDLSTGNIVAEAAAAAAPLVTVLLASGGTAIHHLPRLPSRSAPRQELRACMRACRPFRQSSAC